MEAAGGAEVGDEAGAEAVAMADEFREGEIAGLGGGAFDAAFFGAGAEGFGGFADEAADDDGEGGLVAPELELVEDHLFDDVEFFVGDGVVLLFGVGEHDGEGVSFGFRDGVGVNEELAGDGFAFGVGLLEVEGGFGFAFGGAGSGGELGVLAVGAELEARGFLGHGGEGPFVGENSRGNLGRGGKCLILLGELFEPGHGFTRIDTDKEKSKWFRFGFSGLPGGWMVARAVPGEK